MWVPDERCPAAQQVARPRLLDDDTLIGGGRDAQLAADAVEGDDWPSRFLWCTTSAQRVQRKSRLDAVRGLVAYPQPSDFSGFLTGAHSHRFGCNGKFEVTLRPCAGAATACHRLPPLAPDVRMRCWPTLRASARMRFRAPALRCRGCPRRPARDGLPATASPSPPGRKRALPVLTRTPRGHGAKTRLRTNVRPPGARTPTPAIRRQD